MRPHGRVRGLVLALLLGCTLKSADPASDAEHSGSGDDTSEADSAAPDSGVLDSGVLDTAAPPALLQVFLSNTGNLDEVNGGPCPSAPYQGATCSRSQEAEIAEAIAAHAPDVAVLLEVFDVRDCTDDDLVGEADRVCTGADTHEPYQTARRLLGDGYTISCDAAASRSCIGVRHDRIAMAECAAGGLCMAGSITAPHPEACTDRGPLTSVSRVDLTWTATGGVLAPGTGFSIIAAHALNATDADGDACRQAQYAAAFETLPGAAPIIVAGDMNMDPYRVPDLFASAAYWHTQVGEGRRFTAHSVDGDPPTPTWMGIATLDYVLSDGFAGSCTVLDGAERIDAEGQTLDHRGVLCALE
jgi:hypothetical protein